MLLFLFTRDTTQQFSLKCLRLLLTVSTFNKISFEIVLSFFVLFCFFFFNFSYQILLCLIFFFLSELITESVSSKRKYQKTKFCNFFHTNGGQTRLAAERFEYSERTESCADTKHVTRAWIIFLFFYFSE